MVPAKRKIINKFRVNGTNAQKDSLPSKAPRNTALHKPARIQHRSALENWFSGTGRSSRLACSNEVCDDRGEGERRRRGSRSLEFDLRMNTIGDKSTAGMSATGAIILTGWIRLTSKTKKPNKQRLNIRTSCCHCGYVGIF